MSNSYFCNLCSSTDVYLLNLVASTVMPEFLITFGLLLSKSKSLCARESQPVNKGFTGSSQVHPSCRDTGTCCTRLCFLFAQFHWDILFVLLSAVSYTSSTLMLHHQILSQDIPISVRAKLLLTGT